MDIYTFDGEFSPKKEGWGIEANLGPCGPGVESSGEAFGRVNGLHAPNSSLVWIEGSRGVTEAPPFLDSVG